jgi:hypothetical protein
MDIATVVILRGDDEKCIRAKILRLLRDQREKIPTKNRVRELRQAV